VGGLELFGLLKLTMGLDFEDGCPKLTLPLKSTFDELGSIDDSPFSSSIISERAAALITMLADGESTLLALSTPTLNE